jgi:Protein of unknown function (DUF992)
MNRPHKIVMGLVAAATLSVTAQAHAAPGGVKTGFLTCNVASGWGFIFGSSKNLDCTFAPDNGKAERYSGKINKYGVDIGYSAGGVMVWAVFAPTGDLSPGALQGGYGGATGGASVGVGAYANVLVGGSNNHISLQPVSIEGGTGLNVAAGIGAINLKYMP